MKKQRERKRLLNMPSKPLRLVTLAALLLLGTVLTIGCSTRPQINIVEANGINCSKDGCFMTYDYIEHVMKVRINQ